MYRKGIHFGLRRIHLHMNFILLSEHDFSAIEPEVLCCIHKLQERWNGMREMPGDVNN
jgi:hypothetical protein